MVLPDSRAHSKPRLGTQQPQTLCSRQNNLCLTSQSKKEKAQGFHVLGQGLHSLLF